MNLILRLTAASTGSLALTCGSFLPLAPATSRTPAPAVISASRSFTCAVMSDGTVECWGSNQYGQLGMRCWGKNNFGQLGKAPAGTYLDSDDNAPTPITAPRGAVAVSAGYLHTCAVLATGIVKCWGNGGMGQLGLGQDPPSVAAAPTAVVGLTNMRAVTVGRGHSCAAADATISCWGNNSSGELGGSTYPYEVGISPVPVSGL